MKEPAFHQLRTQEQLGLRFVHTHTLYCSSYHTSGGTHAHEGIDDFDFKVMPMIQSILASRICRVDDFVTGFRTKLEEATDTWIQNIHAVVPSLAGKSLLKNLIQEIDYRYIFGMPLGSVITMAMAFIHRHGDC